MFLLKTWWLSWRDVIPPNILSTDKQTVLRAICLQISCAHPRWKFHKVLPTLQVKTWKIGLRNPRNRCETLNLTPVDSDESKSCETCLFKGGALGILRAFCVARKCETGCTNQVQENLFARLNFLEAFMRQWWRFFRVIYASYQSSAAIAQEMKSTKRHKQFNFRKNKTLCSQTFVLPKL